MDLGHRLTPRRALTWIAGLPGPTIKAALFLGFGLICVTWLFAGYYFSGRMADLERRSTAINQRYMRGQDLLTTARGQVLVASVYVRDALLDPDPAKVEEYRARIDDAYRAADQALQEYVPVLDVPTARLRVAGLRAEIDEFRSAVVQVLSAVTRSNPVDARTLLRREIMPKRETVIRVADEVQALNRGAFVGQQDEIAAIYRATQSRLWGSFGLAVLVSLGIALLAIVYGGRLEGRIQRQRLKEVENTRDLQRLSSRLISAQEEERRVIARELHDEVGQVLTAVKVELALAQQAVVAAGGPPHALDDVRSIADSALHTVRDLSRLLHPTLLDDLGLAAAVEWHLKGFGKRYKLHVDLHKGLDERLSPEIEAHAYRIVQEALTNVSKHARASSCRVYLQRLTNTLLVTVEDDGVGFQTAKLAQADDTRGLGLVGIRERVAHLGGTLRLESAPGRGTRLTVELPTLAGLGERTHDLQDVAPNATAIRGEVFGV